MKSATAFLISGLMRKEAFAGRQLQEAMGAHFCSAELATHATGVECSYSAGIIADPIIRVQYTTTLLGLKTSFAIKHRYSFPLTDEIREIGLILDPAKPSASSEILIANADRRKGYFNIAVHDCENYLISCDVLTYDRAGRVKPYAPMFHDKFESPLQLGRTSLHETVDSRGVRVLRLELELKELCANTQIKVGYNTSGLHEVRVFDVNPTNPHVVSDLLLENNPTLIPGDWVIGVTDERDRMLVNGIVWLESQRA